MVYRTTPHHGRDVTVSASVIESFAVFSKDDERLRVYIIPVTYDNCDMYTEVLGRLANRCNMNRDDGIRKAPLSTLRYRCHVPFRRPRLVSLFFFF